MNRIPYTITDKSIIIFINSKTLTISRNDDRYNEVNELIRTERFDEILDLFDVKSKIISTSNGGLYLRNGVLRCDKFDIPALLSRRITTMIKKGYNYNHLVTFLENLWSNPGLNSRSASENKSVVDEIYGFVEACELPITPDGYILAYKMVTRDFKDLYTKTMDNSVGAIVKMDRQRVDSIRNNTCSSGLHFCSRAYLSSGYGTEHSDQVVVVKINPRDIVSIPTDYNNAKGRACEYEIVDAIAWGEVITPWFTDEYTDTPETDIDDFSDSPVGACRWELRCSVDGAFIDAFETRAEARDVFHSSFDIFIWDAQNNVVIAGSVDDDVDLTNLPTVIEEDDNFAEYESYDIDYDNYDISATDLGFTGASPNPSVKLNDGLVAEILEWLDGGEMSVAAISRRYGVSDRTIRRIRDGESWVHVRMNSEV
jgi:hypothetical protein